MEDLICPRCGNKMVFDDSDFEFPGKGYEIFTCPNETCDCCVELYYRFNKVFMREWYWNDDLQKTENINTSNLNGGEFL